MQGEPINMRSVFDRIESRSYNAYKKTRTDYFKPAPENFQDKTYAQILGSSKKILGNKSETPNIPIDSNILAIVDFFNKYRDDFSLDTYFRQQVQKSENSILKKISKEREARKNQILNDAKMGDLKDINEDYEDEDIAAHVREKKIQRKLLVVTAFWLFIINFRIFLDCLFSYKCQNSGSYFEYSIKKSDQLYRELLKMDFGTGLTNDISLSLKKLEVVKNLQEKPRTDPWFKGVPEGLFSEEPLLYKGQIYFARHSAITLPPEYKLPQETFERPIKDKKMRKIVKEYKILLDKPEDMYALACNLDFNTDYNYVTKSDAKLQIKQLKRGNLMRRFGYQTQAY